MWKVYGVNLQMAEGDFGIQLPFAIRGETLSASDVLRFTFKAQPNGETILTKEYTTTDNASALVLSAADSALLPVGQYAYSVDWYQNGVFMCNIVPMGIFKVVDKA